ncbi:MAG TPA: DUF3160 domain-containing protein [Verrucomicrobiae bacterium]
MGIPPLMRACVLVLSSALMLPFRLDAAVLVHVEKQPDKIILRSDAPPAPLERPAEFVIERSTNLRHWSPEGRSILPKGYSMDWRSEIQGADPHSFFRLRSNFEVELVRAEGADVLGFGDRFSLELQNVGQISTAEFATLFPDRNDYLLHLSWDPTTAEFFEEFQEDILVEQAPPWRVPKVNFKLNETELNVFKTNGFVVTGRITQTNFCDMYYDIFVRDLPVFVTTDSLLHAWFRSYETMLIQLEELYLFPALSNVLEAAAAKLPEVAAEIGSGPLAQNVADIDVYLTVARSLAAGTNFSATLGPQALVDDILARIIGEEFALHFDIYGRSFPSPFDFSQFKVRGHYVGSPLLQRYFKAMMWCGRMDFRVAGNPDHSSARELGSALLLTELLKRSAQLPAWQKMDDTIRQFVGAKDSMDPTEMLHIFQLADLYSVTEIQSTADLDEIKSAIEDGNFGLQEIMGEAFVKPFPGPPIALPRSFALLGQRFTMDAWALSKVMFDEINWVENGRTNEVIRRRTSALDAAFAVLNNNVVSPNIVERIEMGDDGLKFRDGLPYQHNLAAVRRVIDAQQSSYWNSSLYNRWLGALRTLSAPTTGELYPEAMRTRAWALRRLNSQLGSYTQLRHASLLYAKPTYIPFYLCSYPAGFVEPVPHFWAALRGMVDAAHSTIATLPMQGEATWHARQGFTNTTTLDLALVKSNQLQFLARFSTNLGTLKTLSEKELARQPFTEEEETFLLDLVEVQKNYDGEKSYRGWYPRLYYGGNEGFDALTASIFRTTGRVQLDHDASKSAAIVADIANATPDFWFDDPGAVLHQGIGKINFMLVAIDNGPDKMAYGGPVYSHYEFHTEGVVRLNDAEWEDKVLKKQGPPSPDWTQSWLVPGQ